MRQITDQDNYVAPGGQYPYGRLKNDSGAFDGTTCNENLLGDLFQFVMKMMDQAGITPNGIPDNASSGYQIFDAYRGGFFGDLIDVTSYATGWQDNSTDPLKFRKVGSKTVTIRGKTSNVTPSGFTSDKDIFTLPVGYRPAKDRKFVVSTQASDFYAQVKIATTGVVSILGGSTPFDSEETELNISFEID